MVLGMAADVLASPYFVALGVPLLLIVVGAVARKLVRGTAWIPQDFYLGIDLGLAALSAGLIHMYDIVEQMKVGAGTTPAGLPVEQALLHAAGFLVLSIVAMLIVMAVHQDSEKRPRRRFRQFLWLGVVSNVVSGGLLTLFILTVKGVPAP